jgi:hypothetical protein
MAISTFLYLLMSWITVHLERPPLLGPLYQARLIAEDDDDDDDDDDDACGAVRGMRIEEGNRSTWRNVPHNKCHMN